MKFLLVLLVVLFGVWVWRSNRARRDEEDTPRPTRPAGKKPEPEAIEMVRCAYCGVHSPRTDVVVGRKGVYCSAKHRGQAES